MQILAGSWAVIVAIGTTLYEIAKNVYKFLKTAIEAITDALEVVQGIIKGIIDAIRSRINLIIELTGVDVLLDVVRGISYFKDKVQVILDGSHAQIVMVLGDLYRTISGTAKEIIDITSSLLSPIFDRLSQLKSDIKNITDFRLKDITDSITTIADDVKAMNKQLLDDINAEIKEESQRLKDGFAGELAIVDARLTDIISLSKDVEHFAEMFTKIMEL